MIYKKETPFDLLDLETLQFIRDAVLNYDGDTKRVSTLGLLIFNAVEESINFKLGSKE